MNLEQNTPLHTYPITLDEIDPLHLQLCKGGEFLIESHSKTIVSRLPQWDEFVTDVDDKDEESKKDQKKTRRQVTVIEVKIRIRHILHPKRPKR